MKADLSFLRLQFLCFPGSLGILRSLIRLPLEGAQQRLRRGVEDLRSFGQLQLSAGETVPLPRSVFVLLLSPPRAGHASRFLAVVQAAQSGLEGSFKYKQHEATHASISFGILCANDPDFVLEIYARVARRSSIRNPTGLVVPIAC
jgi:hypothetical protein